MKMNVLLIIAGIILISIGVSRITAAQKVKKTSEPKREVVHEVVREVVKAEPVETSSQTESKLVSDNQNKQKRNDNNDKTDDDNFEKNKAIGDAFENYVANLLADWRFTLLDRTQDAVSTAGVVAESSKNPDFHVQQKKGRSNIDYYLECKYRSKWWNGNVAFDDWQIKRYKRFQQETRRKVLIALGVGGTPSKPETLMLVPIDSIHDNCIPKIKTQFVIQPNPSALYDYIENYFSTVFDVAKERKSK